MPSANIKTVKQIIYYQYGKIMADRAKYFGSEKYAFAHSRVKLLCEGKIEWNKAREWFLEYVHDGSCIYCGATGSKLTQEHILPESCGGETKADNMVMVCGTCNSQKGGKRLYEWGGLKAKDSHHRIAQGKYLKYLYDLHEKRGSLNKTVSELCGDCNMGKLCLAEGKAGQLNVFCIEGCFYKRGIK